MFAIKILEKKILDFSVTNLRHTRFSRFFSIEHKQHTEHTHTHRSDCLERPGVRHLVLGLN